jgi:hypothetical protein
MEPPPNRPPVAVTDECPKCHEKKFVPLGRFEEGLGQWVEHRKCANAKCGQIYRRPAQGS